MKTLVTLGLALLPCLTPVYAQELKSNVIIILVDDLGYDEVGFMGSDDIFSPNIDALAAGGTHFTQGYVTSSVCGPSRAGLISGRYQDRFGIWGNFGAKAVKGFPTKQPMLQDRFKNAGYTTGAIGKWHFGQHDEKHKPWNRNFDYFYGFLAGGHSYFNANSSYSGEKDLWPIHRNADIVDYEKGSYLTDEFSREAVDFIEKNHNKPFFLYLAYNAVHYPWVAPQSYIDRVDDLKNGGFESEYRRILSAMMLSVDDGVGRIKETLKRKGIDDNTAIIFLSDNGYQTMLRRTKTANLLGNPASLRGFKGDTYEGGIRVPFIINWPGIIPAGKVYDHPVISLDIAPTITRFLENEEPHPGYDGVDLIPYLNGSLKDAPHSSLFFRYMHDIAYRKGDWVLTWNDQHKEAGEKRSKTGLKIKEVDAMLFNLKNDVEQKKDLRKEFPEKFKELYTEYQNLISDLPESEFPPLFNTPYTVENVEEI